MYKIENIVYFLKFSKREYLEQFNKKALYFSNAETLRGIEENNKIKGQGDRLEGTMRVFATNAELRDPDTGKIVRQFGNSILNVVMEPPNKMPVFCLFSVYKKDCIIDDEGHYHIHLSDKIKQTIHDHFPNANSVAVIPNPSNFISEIENSIGYRMESDNVHYFKIENGVSPGQGIAPVLDLEMIKYLTNSDPFDYSKPWSFSFTVDMAYRHLFCKDTFFSDEQEYRIVLPEESINIGKTYPVDFCEQIEIYDLDEFYSMN